jgi:hypothetical protein
MPDNLFFDFSNAFTPDGNDVYAGSHVGRLRFADDSEVDLDPSGIAEVNTSVSSTTRCLQISDLPADYSHHVIRMCDAAGDVETIPIVEGLGIEANFMIMDSLYEMCFGWGKSTEHGLFDVYGLFFGGDRTNTQGNVNLVRDNAAGQQLFSIGAVQGTGASLTQQTIGFSEAPLHLDVCLYCRSVSGSSATFEIWVRWDGVMQSHTRNQWFHAYTFEADPASMVGVPHIGFRHRGDSVAAPSGSQWRIAKFKAGSGASLDGEPYDKSLISDHRLVTYNTSGNKEVVQVCMTYYSLARNEHVDFVWHSSEENATDGDIARYKQGPNDAIPVYVDDIFEADASFGYHNCNYVADGKKLLVYTEKRAVGGSTSQLTGKLSVDGGETFGNAFDFDFPAGVDFIICTARGARLENGVWIIACHTEDEDMVIYTSDSEIPDSAGDWSVTEYDFSTRVHTPTVIPYTDNTILIAARSPVADYMRYITGSVSDAGVVTLDTADWNEADGKNGRPYWTNGRDDLDAMRVSGTNEVYILDSGPNQSLRNLFRLWKITGKDLSTRQYVDGYRSQSYNRNPRLFEGPENKLGISYALDVVGAYRMNTGVQTGNTTASVDAIQTAFFDRVLSGNHDIEGTPGKILQDVFQDGDTLQRDKASATSDRLVEQVSRTT